MATRNTDRPHLFAALDLGTNNCRLMIARPAGRHFRIVNAFSRTIRLGEGMYGGEEMHGGDILTEAAMARTMEALALCARRLRAHNVGHIRAVATQACRRATNAPDFIAKVRARHGITLEVIDAHEEARLAALSSAELFAAGKSHVLLHDIGGGSSEIVWLDRAGAGPGGIGRIRASISLPHGVATVAERFATAPDRAGAYQAVIDNIAETLAGFAETNAIPDILAGGGVQMVGMSGTVTTLAALHRNMTRYMRAQIDGSTLGFSDIEALSERLLTMELHQHGALNCVGPKRAAFLLPGCAILAGIHRAFPVDALTVSDRGLREGLLLDMMAGVTQRRA